MGTPSSNQYFEALWTGTATPSSPNLFTAAEIVAGSLDSGAISAATSAAVSTVNAAAPDSTSISQARSQAVSAATNASTADSKAVSNSSNVSVADSKAISVSGSTSVADSKATSVGITDSKAISSFTSTLGSSGLAGVYALISGEVGVTNLAYYYDDPKRYGAAGDGATDDTAALENHINSRYATGGGPIQLAPRTTYLLSRAPSDGFTILKSKSGVSVIGSGHDSVIKVANGMRSSASGVGVLYNNTETLSDCTFRDFTVDFNGLNNLDLASFGAAGHINRLGGGAGCSNILVDNLVFKNAAGAHFLFLDGIGGSNVTIRNNIFQECGLSIAGNQTTDHSSIYCTSDRSEITGNTFYNSSACEISTAIETHGSDVNVHHNRIRNYSTAYNLCAQVQTNRDITFSDNIVRNTRNGVFLWTLAGYTLSNLRIHDNTIGLREPTGAYAAGRAMLSNTTITTGSSNISHIAVQNNEIFGETTALLTTLTAGIFLQRADDILISGNKIHNLIAEAIYFEAESTPRTMARIQVLNNEIRDVGLTSTAANKRAIVFNAFNVVGQTISNIDVRGNAISLGAPSGTSASYGIQFNTGSFPNTRVSGNTITGFGTSAIDKGATISADVFYVEGEGAQSPFNLIRASLGSRWVDTSSSPRRTYNAVMSASDGGSDVWASVEYGTTAPASGSHQVRDICYNTGPTATSNVGWVCTALGTPGTWKAFGVLDAISGTKGDADSTIVALVDPTIVWYGTALTSNRTVTLSATNAYNGARFRILRTGLGAFTLDVGGLKTIPNSTAAFVDVAHNGSTWQLAGYGTL